MKTIARLNKQNASGEFFEEEGVHVSSAKGDEPVVMAPPVKTMQAGRLWAISGIYEHQCQKIGFRRLDQIWDSGDLHEFPKGRGALLKEQFFRDLIDGKIQLQATPRNDIAAAQSDIKRLSLVQLLRVRVQTLDYDSKSHGEAAMAFMLSLEQNLYGKLGQHIASSGLLKDDSSPHNIGYQAMLLMSSAGAVPSPCWWSWWPPGSEKQRVFFDAKKFAIADKFPAGGVLEAAIFSKADTNDPSGQLRWMDWQIKVVAKEGDLVREPPHKDGGVGACVSLDVLQATRERLKSRG